MEAIILYYSRFGNTEKIAKSLEAGMRQAAVHAKDELVNPIVKGLGGRIHKVTILNEKDCIKVRQKGGLDKKDQVEIHDIRRVQGFS
ncbi:hypothetical protein [Nitrososphaera sp.]|uniref:hypothetical protein n=1 Tax=Nitrososphaera sp. TaxID=1971748 RepID=UPI00307E5C3D